MLHVLSIKRYTSRSVVDVVGDTTEENRIKVGNILMRCFLLQIKAELFVCPERGCFFIVLTSTTTYLAMLAQLLTTE